jgi:hypothetical protein
MLSRLSLTVAFLGCSSLALGCGAAVDDGDGDSGDDPTEAIGEAEQELSLVSSNSLSPGVLHAHVPQIQKLAEQPLTTAGGVFSPTLLTTTPDGRQILKYLTLCALPAGVTVTVPGWATYHGQYGFAAHWKTKLLSNGPLGPTTATNRRAQRLVTGCMLAHANAYGEPIEINVTANFGDPTRDPVQGFDVQEASFYGNMIAPQADPALGDAALPHSMFACTGANSRGVCDDTPLSQDLYRRICGTSPECGFTVPGSCIDFCTGPSTGYDACFSRPGNQPSSAFEEVITVYLSTTSMIESDLACSNECAHLPTEIGGALFDGCSPCAESVCAVDPYCCNVAWDSICVNEVPTYCTVPISSCSHSTLTTGVSLSADCSECADKVCADDPYCCTTAWDSICVSEAQAWCPSL